MKNEHSSQLHVYSFCFFVSFFPRCFSPSFHGGPLYHSHGLKWMRKREAEYVYVTWKYCLPKSYIPCSDGNGNCSKLLTGFISHFIPLLERHVLSTCALELYLKAPYTALISVFDVCSFTWLDAAEDFLT